MSRSGEMEKQEETRTDILTKGHRNTQRLPESHVKTQKDRKRAGRGGGGGVGGEKGGGARP